MVTLDALRCIFAALRSQSTARPNDDNTVAAAKETGGVVVRAQATLPTMTSSTAVGLGAMANDISTLSTSLLAIAQSASAARARALALVTLREMCETATFRSVFPVKQRVLAALADILNDPKRLVRREAARCRNAWFIIGDDK